MRQWMTEKWLINYEVLYKYYYYHLPSHPFLIFFIFRVVYTEENTVNLVMLLYLRLKI